MGERGVLVSARAVLREYAGDSLASRAELVSFGASLEAETGGSWLAAWLDRTPLLGANRVVIDAVRTPRQARSLQVAHGATLIHLTAELSVRRRRFIERAGEDPADAGGAIVFDALTTHEIERAAASLGDVADFRVDTTTLTEDEVYAAVRNFLDRRGATPSDPSDGGGDASQGEAERS